MALHAPSWNLFKRVEQKRDINEKFQAESQLESQHPTGASTTKTIFCDEETRSTMLPSSLMENDSS